MKFRKIVPVLMVVLALAIAGGSTLSYVW